MRTAYSKVLAGFNPFNVAIASTAFLHSLGDCLRSYWGTVIGWWVFILRCCWTTGICGYGGSNGGPGGVGFSGKGPLISSGSSVMVGSFWPDSLLELSLSLIRISSALSSSLESTGASSVVPEVVESASETIRAYWVVNSLKVIGGSNRRVSKSRLAASTTSSKR